MIERLKYLRGWWKDGKYIDISDSGCYHTEFVEHNPTKFGFSESEIESYRQRFGEFVNDDEGDLTESSCELRYNMLNDGWIIIRGGGREINLECLNDKSKDFKDCVKFIIDFQTKHNKNSWYLTVMHDGWDEEYYTSEDTWNEERLPITDLLKSSHSLFTKAFLYR